MLQVDISNTETKIMVKEGESLRWHHCIITIKNQVYMKPKLLLDFGFGSSFGGSNHRNIEGQIMNLKNKYISIIGAGEVELAQLCLPKNGCRCICH